MAPEASSFELEGPCAYKDEDVWSAAPFWIDSSFVEPENGVLHVLTRSAAERGNAKNVKAHVWSGELPPGSLFEYDAHVAIATPGFTFLQLATELDFAELVAYGDEICGLYALNAAEPLGYKKRAVPLITLHDLAAFVESAEGMRGYRQAAKALLYVVEGSLSPADTMAEMLLCLTVHRGGYGLSAPEMGCAMELTQRSTLLAGAERLSVSAYWPDSRLCLDVVSQAGAGAGAGEASTPKGTAPSRSFDEARGKALALRFSDYDVVSVSSDALEDLMAFEAPALDVARALGKFVPKKKRGALPQRELLRETLASWTSAHGHAQ